MGLLDFLKVIPKGTEMNKNAANIDDYTELEVQESSAGHGNIGRYVKVCKLKGFADVDITARELSQGNVVILDIKPLAERNMNELKHAIDEIKDIVGSMGGDLAGLSEFNLIITPPTMRIDRSTESRLSEFESTMDRVRSKVSR